ncbi:hypothetical protein E2C01_074960 [Portunus trituberculatus]|uniref:Uncharacterized protein n=1 Tax=Portunus trituberculatus TaxID=210409 RepID=A0A5B7I9D9_PORTR|nr:hypothetical protein [Portunus trituberculatus]
MRVACGVVAGEAWRLECDRELKELCQSFLLYGATEIGFHLHKLTTGVPKKGARHAAAIRRVTSAWPQVPGTSSSSGRVHIVFTTSTRNHRHVVFSVPNSIVTGAIIAKYLAITANPIPSLFLRRGV